ncbi:cytochrome c [Flavobacterium sp.]|uniref:cytochrome c n=1 Tax=Flavobacterium sp. TaxID=239 RepID=UPI00260EDADF|nr:cytochrome c [Flavobacterium sp.]
MKLKILGLAVIAAVVYSCASKSAVASSSQASPAAPETPATPAVAIGKSMEKVAAPTPPKDSKGNIAAVTSELSAGKTNYENNCAKCHKLFDPRDFSKAEWAPILVTMQKKAHLTDAEMAPITNYIYTHL